MQLFNDLPLIQEKHTELRFITIKTIKERTYAKYLEKLPLSDLNNIIQKFNIANERLTKKAKIDFLINNLSSNILSFKPHINNDHLQFIKKLTENNGIIKYHTKHLGYLLLFSQFGFCFPIVCNKIKYIVMPKEVYLQFSDYDEKLIKQNTIITKYINGMINLYGIVEIDYLIDKINNYLNTTLNNTYILSIINFISIYNKHIIYQEKFLMSAFINSSFENYQNIRETIPNYYPFTDDEILAFANPNILNKDPITEQHIINVANIFNLDNKTAETFLIRLIFILREDVHFQLLISLFQDINNDNMTQKLEYILNINDHIPKWSLKGHKYYQVDKISPLTIKKLIELLLINQKNSVSTY